MEVYKVMDEWYDAAAGSGEFVTVWSLLDEHGNLLYEGKSEEEVDRFCTENGYAARSKQ